jgi:hypothetical protein
MTKLTPTLLMNVTLLIALGAMAHGAFAGEMSPIFGSNEGPTLEFSVDPQTGKPLVLAEKK